jgi:hypothetical protein
LQASLGDSCENKENDELMAEACRQAAKQASATLRQKVRFFLFTRVADLHSFHPDPDPAF